MLMLLALLAESDLECILSLHAAVVVKKHRRLRREGERREGERRGREEGRRKRGREGGAGDGGREEGRRRGEGGRGREGDLTRIGYDRLPIMLRVLPM